MRARSFLFVGVRVATGALALAMLACGGGSGTTTHPTPVSSYILTVNSATPSSGVSITAAPADLSGKTSGSTSFSLTYDAGASVTLTAPSTSGTNTFASWTGCTAATGATCTVSLNANTTVTANYAAAPPTTYVLTVNSTNPATGVAIGVSPADVNAATSGTTSFNRTYDSGASVTLTAPATSGSNTFSSWSGCASTSTVTCTVSLTANTTVTANYTTPTPPPPTTYTLTVASTNPATGVAITVSPADVNAATSGATSFTRTYASGAAVTLTAPATAGSNTFTSWTGCTSTTGMVCMEAVNANTTVTANYSPASGSSGYTLTVNSTNPATGVAIAVSPADANGSGNGSTSFTRTYNKVTTVALTAPSTSGTSTFSSWSGCSSATSAICTVLLSADTTVTANYLANGVSNITISPGAESIAIGTTVQFSATVQGNGTFDKNVTWSVAAPAGYSGSAGDITAAGLYTTPSPAPPTVTITATGATETTKSSSITLTLTAAAATAGPALSVDLGTPTRAISPLIYGVNGYDLDTASATKANVSIIRWGGDNTSRYNYVANTTNAANDYYFENFTGAGGQWPDTTFNGLVTQAAAIGAEVVGTAPVIGWVSNSNVSGNACSFQKSAYPNQQSYTPSGLCGNGVQSDGTNLVGNDTIAAITSMKEPPPTPPAAGTPVGSSWTGNWVTSLVNQFGPGNPSTGTGKGVAHWDLDNEPEYWSGVHRDVHPLPMTYDEITNGGIGTALAIKTADATALVSGPVISGWYNYFYSEKDVTGGYSTGPCYKPSSDPVDRNAHGGVPLIEYYLQQMKAAQATYGQRLLDYVDIHTYFAANYNGSSTGLTSAGDTAEQMARINSTRVFWDPTYTDPNYPQPNYPTDANYDSKDCNIPLQAPELIPMMQSWVAKDYPGTKTSIDEYNFGGMEAINGALTQADILGIFGKYGLDKGMLWPTTNYSAQVPGTEAFAIYRNYDGSDSGFGDLALTSTTADQGKLSVYGAARTSDGAVTIVVINKTYGDLTSTLSLPNLTPTGPAQVFLYSNANLSAIVAQSPQTLTPPSGSVTSDTLSMTYPAQSITLLVIPTR